MLCKKTKTKPTLLSPIIIIPLHVNLFHWVSLVRRVRGDKVFFYYCDDLNSSSCAMSIQGLYDSQSTSTSFHPHDAEWINCSSFTYLPHSNEYGPRLPLASSIFATHPNPSQLSLLLLMHPNLAQLSRWWVAKSIINQVVDCRDLHPFYNMDTSDFDLSSLTWTSTPYDLAELNHSYKDNENSSP